MVPCSPKNLVSLGEQRGDSEVLLAGLWAPMQVLGCLCQPALTALRVTRNWDALNQFLFFLCLLVRCMIGLLNRLACFVEQREDFECEWRLKVAG